MSPDNKVIILAFLSVSISFYFFVSFVTNTGFAASHEPGFDFWGGIGWWIEKAGILVISVTLIVYWHQQRSDRHKERRERSERIRSSCDIILEEIKEYNEAFTSNDKIIIEKKQFTTTYLATDAYDSLINSGLLTYLTSDTQKTLAHLYLRIKIHNDNITYSLRFRGTSLSDKSATEVDSLKFFRILTSSEEQIITLLPLAEKYVKEEKLRAN